MNSRPQAIRRALFPALRAAALLACLALAACGYALENSKTNSLKEVGVSRVYIAPVKNLTYKPGVENTVYNELVQALLAGGRLKLADKPQNADAILESSVDTAIYIASANANADSIFPITVKAIQITVATEYQANMTCSFHLKRQKNGDPQEVLWESSFTRSKRFTGSNQKIEYGTTSGLINESEFDRTLQDVSHSMMSDVNEAMVARF
jgi:outer membrane lipopolysaccharide assembly protein LptE/RlpB